MGMIGCCVQGVFRDRWCVVQKGEMSCMFARVDGV